MRSEGIDERDVSGVASTRDHNPANSWNIVARIERMPRTVEENLDPSAEIHRIDDRHTDVAQMAIHVACGDIEAAAEGDRQMREVAAHPDTLMESFERRACCAGLHIVETDVGMHEVADGLHPAPATRNLSEYIPGDLAETIRLAIAAAHEVAETFIGQIRHWSFPGLGHTTGSGLPSSSIVASPQIMRSPAGATSRRHRLPKRSR